MSKMGIAWAMANAMAKYEDKVFKYLENSTLDGWTYNKALSKMKESFTVSENAKKKISLMKR